MSLMKSIKVAMFVADFTTNTYAIDVSMIYPETKQIQLARALGEKVEVTRSTEISEEA